LVIHSGGKKIEVCPQIFDVRLWFVIIEKILRGEIRSDILQSIKHSSDMYLLGTVPFQSLFYICTFDGNF
jgi:hypothetical protein